MSLLRWFKSKIKVKNANLLTSTEDLTRNDDNNEGVEWQQENEAHHYGIKLVYFASKEPNENVVDILRMAHMDTEVSLHTNSFFGYFNLFFRL